MGVRNRRSTARVKLPIRQAHEIEATLYNVREFCGMNGASQELMEHIMSCMQNITRGIAERNRVIGIQQSPLRKVMAASKRAARLADVPRRGKDGGTNG